MPLRTRPGPGFTFIEILMALALISVLFIPTMQLFSHAMEATHTSRDLITAVSLARWEMERVKNLGGTRLTLVKTQGNTTWPPAEEPALEMNGRSWRILRTLKPDSDPLEVEVLVYPEGEEAPLASLTTLLSETVWGQKQRMPS